MDARRQGAAVDRGLGVLGSTTGPGGGSSGPRPGWISLGTASCCTAGCAHTHARGHLLHSSLETGSTHSDWVGVPGQSSGPVVEHERPVSRGCVRVDRMCLQPGERNSLNSLAWERGASHSRHVVVSGRWPPMPPFFCFFNLSVRSHCMFCVAWPFSFSSSVSCGFVCSYSFCPFLPRCAARQKRRCFQSTEPLNQTVAGAGAGAALAGAWEASALEVGVGGGCAGGRPDSTLEGRANEKASNRAGDAGSGTRGWTVSSRLPPDRAPSPVRRVQRWRARRRRPLNGRWALAGDRGGWLQSIHSAGSVNMAPPMNESRCCAPFANHPPNTHNRHHRFIRSNTDLTVVCPSASVPGKRITHEASIRDTAALGMVQSRCWNAS